jgi:hypothetical protein
MKPRSDAARELIETLGLDPKKVTLLDYGPSAEERGRCYPVGGGKSIYIARPDMALIEKLWELPAATRVKIMNLSDEELEKVRHTQRKVYRDQLWELLHRRWSWRETGERVGNLDGLLPHTHLGQKGLLNALKRGSKLANWQLKEIIDWFLGDRAQVYAPEEAGTA